MAFGEKISKQFVDALEGGHDSRAAVNLHNNEAGRLVRYDFTFTVVIQVLKKKIISHVFCAFKLYHVFLTQLRKRKAMFSYIASAFTHLKMQETESRAGFCNYISHTLLAGNQSYHEESL